MSHETTDPKLVLHTHLSRGYASTSTRLIESQQAPPRSQRDFERARTSAARDVAASCRVRVCPLHRLSLWGVNHSSIFFHNSYFCRLTSCRAIFACRQERCWYLASCNNSVGGQRRKVARPRQCTIPPPAAAVVGQGRPNRIAAVHPRGLPRWMQCASGQLGSNTRSSHV